VSATFNHGPAKIDELISAAFDTLEAGGEEVVAVAISEARVSLQALFSKLQPIDEKICTLIHMCGFLCYEDQVFSMDLGMTYVEQLSKKREHKVELLKNKVMLEVVPPSSALNPEAPIFVPSASFQNMSHHVSATCIGDSSEAAESIRGFWDVLINSVASFSWDEVNSCRMISSISVPPWLMYRWTSQQIIDAAWCPGCRCEVSSTRCYSCGYAIRNALFENTLCRSASKPKAETSCKDLFENDLHSSVSNFVAESDLQNSCEFELHGHNVVDPSGMNSDEFTNACSSNAWGELS